MHRSSLKLDLNKFIPNQRARRHLLYYFLITIVFFGTFIKPDFATDTYADIMLNPNEIIANFLQSGRFITVFFFIIFRFLHIGISMAHFASFALAVLSLTLALYLLERIFFQHLAKGKDKKILFFLPLLIIMNPFIIELFLFAEKGIMIFGILACVIATYFYADYLDNRRRSYFLCSLSCSILAALCYQGIVGLFIVLATVITLAKFTTWRVFFMNTALSILIYVSGPIIDILLAKIFASGGRIGGEIILNESMQKISAGFSDMTTFFGVVPSSTYWVCLAVILAIWILYRLRTKQLFTASTVVTVSQCLYLTSVIILAAIAPQFVQQTSSIWVTPRATYIFASTIGIILTTLVIRDRDWVSQPLFGNGLIFAILVLLYVQFANFNTVTIDHYSLAEIDRLRAQTIGRLITEYESDHNVSVESIMVAPDQNQSYSYPGIFVMKDINISAFSTPWSDVSSIGYWNGRRFERLEPTSDWAHHCSATDWQFFDTVQVQFDEGVLCLCLF